MNNSSFCGFVKKRCFYYVFSLLLFSMSCVFCSVGAHAVEALVPSVPVPNLSSISQKSVQLVKFEFVTVVGGISPEENGIGHKIIGSVGFIFPKEHPGGILHLGFAQPIEKPVPVELFEYPYTIDPQKAIFDGKAIEIQIAPGQAYFFLQFKDRQNLLVSKIEFKPGESLSALETCDCRQIKLSGQIAAKSSQ